jgi:4-hydroxybenzoate polyprenyltransferase
VYARLSRLVRAGEWWEHKLVPIVCGYYATALMLGRPLTEGWSGLLIFFLSLIPGAAYVSIVNDLTDLAADSRAGKPNRMACRSGSFRAAALLSCFAGGALFFWLWRERPLLIALYGAAWIAFALYSVPPVRLKVRGFPGVVADAAGAHLFPTLLAAALAFGSAGAGPSPGWMTAIGIWSFGYGLRSNLWHQLLDRGADRAAGLTTFGARESGSHRVRIAVFASFLAEMAGLAVVIAGAAPGLLLLALVAYLLLVRRRVRLWRMQVVLAAPRQDYLIFLHEYYDVFLPLAMLAAATLAHPKDGLLLAGHLILFHGRPARTWHDGWSLIGRPLLRRARLVS